MEEDLLKRMKKSQFLSPISDSSKDISNHENQIIYLRYYDNELLQFRTAYFCDVFNSSHVGKDIFTCIISKMEKAKLSTSKIISFGSDGVEYNSGYISGAISYFMKMNPFILYCVCYAHKLSLCIKTLSGERFKGNPGFVYFKEVIQIMEDLHHFFSSSKRLEELDKFQKEHNIENLNILEMTKIRWLSLSNCVSNLVRIMPSVLHCLNSEIDELRSKHFRKETAESKFYLKYECIFTEMTTFRFQSFLHFLCDILNESSYLCKMFQKEDINLFDAFDALQILRNSLQKNYFETKLYGENYQYFCKEFEKGSFIPEFQFKSTTEMKNETFELLKAFSSSFYLRIQEDFPSEADLLYNFRIFSGRSLISLSDSTTENEKVLLEFGKNELEKLLVHYGEEKINNNGKFKALINPAVCRNE